MLESKRISGLIFRIARKPDPWQPIDWSRANSDGTFGNRFDDPEGHYRVLYASSQKLSCYLETLARFRPDLSLLTELNEISGENDFSPLGEVHSDWCDRRLLGSASAEGEYADIYASGWIGFLRSALASECSRLGLQDLDAGVLQQHTPRRLTQMASMRVYEQGFDGIAYRSRFGHNLDNWALFEPFHITPGVSEYISADDPILREALDLFGLRIV